MNLHRRHLLQAAVAASAAAATPFALAKAPLGTGQTVSIHRMKLGEFEVITLLDGYIDLNPAILMGDQAVIKELLENGGVTGNAIRTAVNSFIVNTGEKLVMIDCGGAKMLGPTAGRMPLGLAAAGIDPAAVDEVYITHMHGDHLHGAVTPEGKSLFPNAVLRIAKPDVDFWGSAAEKAKVPDNQKGRFAAAERAIAAYGDRLKTFTLGDELTPGIRSVAAAGHTPGHSCYMVTSGQAKLLLLGDSMHVAPVQFPRPEITVAFDSSQDAARAWRKQLFEMAAKEKFLIGAVHLPFPGIGRLRGVGTGGTGYAFDPLPWQLF